MPDDAENKLPAAGEEALSGREIKRLAGTGVAALGLRQLAIRALGLGGTVVLARLLTPRDFGTVAFGTTVVTVFMFVGDSGIGAGLIRRATSPERDDLRSVLGLQLLVTTILALLAVAIGLPNGEVGRVTALMVCALPLAAFQTPGVIMFERELRYQPLVMVELAGVVAYYLWAIATVSLGWGVWGLASAAPVRAIVGTALLTVRSPVGFLLPALSWTRLRGLLRFGLQFQAISAVTLVRDQGLNLGIAAIGGVAALGFWSLAYRILQVPFLLFDSVWRVSFPAMARLLAAGEDAGPIMERGLGLAAIVTGGLLAILVGATPALVPAVFGQQWSAVAYVIPWAALGLMFSGPISVATGGYLYAVGDSGAVLLSGAVQAVVWLLVAFTLLPFVGIPALGIAWMTSSIVESFVLTNRTRRHSPIRVTRQLAVPASIAAIAATCGWFAASRLGPTLLATAAGAAIAGVVYGAVVFVVRRDTVNDALMLGRRSFGSLRGGSA